MTRSTKAEKAGQLNAARGLLQRRIALPEAMRRLSREFDLSERQAYRYLEEASQLDRPVEVPETTIAGYAEASHADGGTAPEVREKQRSDHRRDRSRCVAYVSAHSKKAWLSRGKKAAHYKSTFPIRLIACSSRSSRRFTTFWYRVASAPSACA
jgi:hypothetical protein